MCNKPLSETVAAANCVGQEIRSPQNELVSFVRQLFADNADLRKECGKWRSDADHWQKENERLREALKPMAQRAKAAMEEHDGADVVWIGLRKSEIAELEAAKVVQGG